MNRKTIGKSFKEEYCLWDVTSYRPEYVDISEAEYTPIFRAEE